MEFKMIYIALLLAFIVFVFGVLLRFYNRKSQTLALESDPDPARFSDENTLEHNDLLTLIGDFDYQHGEGVCHGFTLSWAQESVLGRGVLFYERLNLIKKEKDSLQDQVETMAEKIKLNQALSKKELRLKEIRPFIESITLAQYPDEYQSFYSREIHQADTNHIMQMIRLQLCHEANKVKSLFTKSYAFKSKKELQNCLLNMEKQIEVADTIAIVASSEEHTVGFRRHKNGWLFIDINQLYKDKSYYPYQVVSSKQLADELYGALFEKSSILLLNCSFISSNLEKAFSQRIRQLEHFFSISNEHLRWTNCREIGLLTLAAQSGDLKTARKILSLDRKSNLLAEAELLQALYYATTSNRESIVALFLRENCIDINTPCNEDGETALILAASYGYINLVKRYLNHPDVEVDKQDAEGLTPLMAACESANTKGKNLVFKLLLDAGSSLKLVSKKGANALALARQCYNQTALDEINRFASDHKVVSPLSNTRSKTQKIIKASSSFFSKPDCPKDMDACPSRSTRATSHSICH